MKELDVLLEAFLARESANLEQGAWPELESFLAEEDDRLWDWFQGNALPDNTAQLNLIDAIRG